MDQYARMDQRTPAARHEAIWSAIATSAYLAPARIALDDRRERILAGAAQARLLASKRSALRSSAGVGCVATTARRRACLPRRIVGLLRVVKMVGLLRCAGLGSRSPGAEAPTQIPLPQVLSPGRERKEARSNEGHQRRHRDGHLPTNQTVQT